MKRSFLVILLLVVLTFTISCGHNSELSIPTDTPSPEPTEIPYRQLNGIKEYKIDLLKDSGSDMSDVALLCTKYIEAIRLINPSLKPSTSVMVYDKKEGDNPYITQYRMHLNGNCDLWIKERDSNIYKTNIDFDFDKDGGYIKDLFAATIMVLNNNSISVEEAKKQGQDIANSYQDSGYGQRFDVNGYKVYTVAFGSSKDFYFRELLVFNEAAMQPSVEELAEYAELSYETASNSKMNKGMKDIISGTVKTYTLDNIGMESSRLFFLVDGDDGQEYKMYFNYAELPAFFETKTHYTFYGTVEDDISVSNGLPLISVDWYVQ